MEAHLWHMFAFVLDTPPPKTSMTGWNIHHLKMYFLLKMWSFERHVNFPECISVQMIARPDTAGGSVVTP